MASTRRWHRAAALWAVLALGFSAVAIGVVAPRADAHTPHDDVADVAFSPTYAKDGKVFVISGNRMLVSTNDSYHWKPLVRGLPRPPEDQKSLAKFAISTTDPGVMYVSSRIGGVFRSADGGNSWHAAASGIWNPDIQPIAVSPRSSNIVLAAGSLGGFYRTADAGQHWTSIPGFPRVPAVKFLATGRAVAGDQTGQLWTSDDNGATWQKAGAGLGSAVNSIGSSGATVFAGTQRGTMARSDDNAGTFTKVGNGLPLLSIVSIAPSPQYATDHTVWLTNTDTGVFQSKDGGATWDRDSLGLFTDTQAHTVGVAEWRTIAVANDASGARVRYVAGFAGLFRSNGSQPWKKSETLVDFIVGLDVSPDYAKDKSVAVASYVKGAYITSNDGKTWRRINKGLDQLIGAGNRFAPVRRLHNIVFSPDYANDHTIFSNTWDHFLKSTDSGQSWSTIQVGPAPKTQLLRQFVIGMSPNYTLDHTIFMGTRQGAIFESTKSGDPGSWNQVGSTGQKVRSLVLVPSFPDDPVLYAGTYNGVMKSEDKGVTWKRTGPPGTANLAISPDYDNDGTVFAATDSGLFVTRDEGKSWSELSDAPLTKTTSYEAIAVSPAYKDDKTVLVGATGQGLFRSRNGGRSFTEVGKDLIDDNLVIADYTNPTGTPIQFSPDFAKDHTIYGYAGQDVVRSTDAGNTWDVIRLPSAAAFLATVDPKVFETGQHAAGHLSGQRLASSSSSGSSSRSTLVYIGIAVLVLLIAIGGGLWWRRRHSVGPRPAA